MSVDDPGARVPLDSLAVFPLPNTVFFPDQRLPLHIFEPRYRQMVRDALEGDAPYLVVARMETGAPGAFARVATAGRIVAHQRLSDGRFNILLEGAARVTIEEIASDKLYRRVRCVPMPEPRGEAAEVPSTLRAGLLSTLSLVMQAARVRGAAVTFDTPNELAPARLAWRVADKFVADADARQAILEADDAHTRVVLATASLAHTLSELSPTLSRGGLS